MYRNYDIENSVHSQLTILKIGFFQKILGFNRHVPWPVHWTSSVSCCDNIMPGTRTPGLGKGCHIDGRNGIKIGKNVWIGPHVKIISMNHNVNNYHYYIKAGPIIIGDNCWLGASVIILPEVELGEHTVVAAGAIVTKSFPDGNQVIGGNPAKVIKRLDEYE
jgi:acetyltransferase-like isoleucine patch superfamily enzyme